MSVKQFERSVLDGRLLHIHIPGLAGEITGYVCGIDNFHLLLIAPDSTVFLVHKGGASLITFGAKTYANEPRKAELENLVAPFRQFIESKRRQQANGRTA